MWVAGWLGACMRMKQAPSSGWLGACVRMKQAPTCSAEVRGDCLTYMSPRGDTSGIELMPLPAVGLLLRVNPSCTCTSHFSPHSLPGYRGEGGGGCFGKLFGKIRCMGGHVGRRGGFIFVGGGVGVVAGGGAAR